MKLKLAALIFYVIDILSVANAQAASINETVNWQPCPPQNLTTLSLQCSNFTVPLDYSDPTSNRTLDLQLVRLSAANQPRKGSILINPGGPGDSGRDIIASFAEAFRIATGGYYDIIGFDPRGVGNTLTYSCYQTTTERTIASLAVPRLINESDTALGSIWAGKQAFARQCYEINRDRGELIGTAFVARDMIRIAEALDDDGLLRYWGFSYGTILGATTAAMFPEKIDRMVLDGVVNPFQWYGGSAVDGVTQGDTVLDGFFEGCLANPDQCLLAQDGDSAVELSEKTYQFLDTLKFNPILIGSDISTDLVTYGIVKSLIAGALYAPSYWPALGDALHASLTGNVTAFSEYIALLAGGAISASPFSPSTPDAEFGIQCAETSLRTNNVTSLVPLIDATIASSSIEGDNFAVLQPITCAAWLFTAKEIYKGNFRAQTRQPILLIGGPFDPVTPLISARNVSAGFEGSEVLQHNGYGHTSLGQASLCTARNIRAYFVDGTLPPPGMVCQPDQALFTNETIDEAIQPIANFTERALERNDDAQLLAAITKLSKGMRSRVRI